MTLTFLKYITKTKNNNNNYITEIHEKCTLILVQMNGKNRWTSIPN